LSIDLSREEARRIAVAAAGFARPRPRLVQARHVTDVLRQLRILQLDFVNVLAPAPYFVLFSRLGLYDRKLLDDVVYRRRQFVEAWAHEASIVPVEDWALLRHRRETHRVRPWGFESFLDSNPAYCESVVEEVRQRGPLASDELPLPEGVSQRIPGAWYTVTRAVMEAHFGRGTLAVAARRADFARIYDLAERIVAAEHSSRNVTEEEAERQMIRNAAQVYGVASAGDLADYYRMPIRRARERVHELAASGELLPAEVEGWREPAYLASAAKRPSRIEAAALVSPFDPLVWYRPRLMRLFSFEYTIEIYLPKEKRKWGYYVLPFLLGDRLVARVDLKADRSRGTLVVASAHLEDHSDPAEVSSALAKELRLVAAWLGLQRVQARRRGRLNGSLRKALD